MMPKPVDFGGQLARECAERADVEDLRVKGRLELRDRVALRFFDDLGEFSVRHLKALTHAIGDVAFRLRYEADATGTGSERQDVGSLSGEPTASLARIVRSA